MSRTICHICIVVLFCGSAGCSDIVKFAVDKTQPHGNERLGVVYYVGGAGPVGNIGSFDVPRGMRAAGFMGHVEVVPWQSWTHAGDQLNLGRNREKAAELADKIQRFRRVNPDAPIHIIALSAGTGIATFALEFLPESVRVDNVAFLACSMSSYYDMTRALRRVGGKLFVLYSPSDVVLKNVVWYTGTVDRQSRQDSIAGLEGFTQPPSPYPDTKTQYKKVVNVPYRSEFRDAGYDGGHVTATTESFVRFYLAPALMENERRLVGSRPGPRLQPPDYAKSKPATPKGGTPPAATTTAADTATVAETDGLDTEPVAAAIEETGAAAPPDIVPPDERLTPDVTAPAEATSGDDAFVDEPDEEPDA